MLGAPFWAGATHVVQFGSIWIEQRRREPAPPPRGHTTTRPRAGVANNTLETYESENVLILNLVQAGLAAQFQLLPSRADAQ